MALLEECEWGEPGDDDPKQHLNMLLDWIPKLMASCEGHPEGAYEGTHELEHDAQE